MKSLKKFMLVLAITTVSSFYIIDKVEAQVAVSFQVFYDDLSPYGHWVNDPEFGFVWMPAVVAGFSPYGTAGHWVLTDYGWTWVSDYPWGWAPFHYGRWRYNDFYGWQWIPGNEWAPAWVSWRRAKGYYGWAPLEPGISINVAIGNGYYGHHPHWVFVQERHINNPILANYYASDKDNVTIIKNSTVINNTYVDNSSHSTYIAGPKRDEVEKTTGAHIKTASFKERSKPGQSVNSNEVDMYRPVVSKNETKENRPAPCKVTDLKDVKPIHGKQPPVEAQKDKNNETGNVHQKQNGNDDVKRQPADRSDMAPQKNNDMQRDQNNNIKKERPEQGKRQQEKKNSVTKPRESNHNEIRRDEHPKH